MKNYNSEAKTIQKNEDGIRQRNNESKPVLGMQGGGMSFLNKLKLLQQRVIENRCDMGKTEECNPDLKVE